MFRARILLKHGAVLQCLGCRAVLEDVVIETSELLSHVLGGPPSHPPVLHGEQLGAQVVEPQHVGMRLVAAPVITDNRRNNSSISTKVAANTVDKHGREQEEGSRTSHCFGTSTFLIKAGEQIFQTNH